MAKKETAKEKEEVALANLKAMFRKGAGFRSPGNIPTGHFELDFIIHHGESPSKVDLDNLKGYDPGTTLGIPLGKVIEIYGEEGSGKSSLAYRIVGYAQKMGLECAWIDTENSFSNNLAWINGADRAEILYCDMCNDKKPDEMFYAEDVLDAIVGLCKQGVKVIVLDSVANLTPKVRMEANAEQFTVGVIARLMSENLGKIVNYAASHGVLVIFINQLREKIGQMFGNPETTPGGRALKFNASLRIRVGKNNKKEADLLAVDGGSVRTIGHKAKVKVEKNRFGKPYKEALDIPIYYEPYFPDPEELLFDLGRQLKIITVRLDVYKWGDVKVEGKEEFIDGLKYDKKLLKSLLVAIKKTAEEKDVILPPEVKRLEQDLEGEKIDGNPGENAEGTPGARKKKSDSPGDSVPKKRGRPKRSQVSE